MSRQKIGFITIMLCFCFVSLHGCGAKTGRDQFAQQRLLAAPATEVKHLQINGSDFGESRDTALSGPERLIRDGILAWQNYSPNRRGVRAPYGT